MKPVRLEHLFCQKQNLLCSIRNPWIAADCLNDVGDPCLRVRSPAQARTVRSTETQKNEAQDGARDMLFIFRQTTILHIRTTVLPLDSICRTRGQNPHHHERTTTPHLRTIR
jgi:hypothetical protein